MRTEIVPVWQESCSAFQCVLDGARHRTARYYLSRSILRLTETESGAKLTNPAQIAEGSGNENRRSR